MIAVTDSHTLTIIIARLITGHIVKKNEFYYMKLIYCSCSVLMLLFNVSWYIKRLITRVITILYHFHLLADLILYESDAESLNVS